jgi:hypothetical protein
MPDTIFTITGGLGSNRDRATSGCWRGRVARRNSRLLLSHELALLRRRAGRPRLSRADRALFAALSRAVPRTAWTSFAVKPDTLLPWHRKLVARRWTYTRRRVGRSALASSLRKLILRLARENPPWDTSGSSASSRPSAPASRQLSVRKALLERSILRWLTRRRSPRPAVSSGEWTPEEYQAELTRWPCGAHSQKTCAVSCCPRSGRSPAAAG